MRSAQIVGSDPVNARDPSGLTARVVALADAPGDLLRALLLPGLGP